MSVFRRNMMLQQAPEYCVIKSADPCYVDTQIQLFNYDNFRIDYDFDIRQYATYAGVVATSAFSTSEESWLTGNTFRFRCLGLNLSVYPFTFVQERLVLTLERQNGVFYVYKNGVLQTSANTSTKTTNTIVFPRLTIPTLIHIYNFRMYAEGTLVYDARPIIVNGEMNMINVVTNQLIYKVGNMYVQ